MINWVFMCHGADGVESTVGGASHKRNDDKKDEEGKEKNCVITSIIKILSFSFLHRHYAHTFSRSSWEAAKFCFFAFYVLGNHHRYVSFSIKDDSEKKARNPSTLRNSVFFFSLLIIFCNTRSLMGAFEKRNFRRKRWVCFIFCIKSK